MDQGRPAGAKSDACLQTHQVGLMGGGEQLQPAVAVKGGELAVEAGCDRTRHRHDRPEACLENAVGQIGVTRQRYPRFVGTRGRGTAGWNRGVGLRRQRAEIVAAQGMDHRGEESGYASINSIVAPFFISRSIDDVLASA